MLNQEKLTTLGQIVHRFVLSQRCSYGLSPYPELQEFLRNEPHMATLLSFSEGSYEGSNEPILQLKDAYTSPSFSRDNSHASSFEDSNSFLEDSKSLSGSRSSVISPSRSAKFSAFKTLYNDNPRLDTSGRARTKSASPKPVPKINTNAAPLNVERPKKAPSPLHSASSSSSGEDLPYVARDARSRSQSASLTAPLKSRTSPAISMSTSASSTSSSESKKTIRNSVDSPSRASANKAQARKKPQSPEQAFSLLNLTVKKPESKGEKRDKVFREVAK